MHWSLLIFAALGLLGAHVLRLPGKGRLVGGLATFLSGLILTAFLIRMIAGAAGIGRTTEFDGFVTRAAEIAQQTEDAPLIIFSGASYSRNAIDDERLTLALSERGYPHRALNLSLEAASMLERDTHLRTFMAQANRTPDMVWIEIAKPFDTHPAYIFENSKFSARAIEQFHPEAALWTAYGLAGGNCEGAGDCVKQAGLLGLHAGLNWLNVGLIGRGEVTADVPGAPSFDGQAAPRMTFTDNQVTDGLMTASSVSSIEGPQWARSFRAQQREALTSQGVRRIGYYFPPVIDPDLRVYAASLCAGELAAFPCIAPTDPDLLEALNGPYWFDDAHLLDTGAAIYDLWLTDQLERSGELEGPVRTPIASLRGRSDK